ncbi:hypothetical protein ATCC90586_012197 [Pythium insidiosum]|nr:hypothetical protein ATCC90586_012197 [Pythium insidiosum]
MAPKTYRFSGTCQKKYSGYEPTCNITSQTYLGPATPIKSHPGRDFTGAPAPVPAPTTAPAPVLTTAPVATTALPASTKPATTPPSTTEPPTSKPTAERATSQPSSASNQEAVQTPPPMYTLAPARDGGMTPESLSRDAASAPTPLRREIFSPPARGRVRPTAARALTPQFHWNLNQTAAEALPQCDLVTLYQLFRLYDSSCVGDRLPALHVGRFVALLRDARLLRDEGDDPVADPTAAATRPLRTHEVDTVFAHAVLGKMRAYLDAEDVPAMTFAPQAAL